MWMQVRGCVVVHISGLGLHVNMCQWNPSGRDKECIQKKRGERERVSGEGENERERVSVCVKELFHLHPRIPGEVFHANPFPGVGFSLTQWDDTHIHTNLALLTPLWKLCNLGSTHRRTHSAHWDDSEEMASSSWGVPSLFYRNCSTPEASPHPSLHTLCPHVHLSRCVLCCVFVLWQICVRMSMCEVVPPDQHHGTCRALLMLTAP